MFLPSRLADGEKIAGSYGLADYAKAGYPVTAGGNAYFAPAQPFPADTLDGVRQRPEEEVVIEETADGVFIVLPDVELPTAGVGIVRGGELGQTVLAKTGYENPDGSSVVFDTLFFLVFAAISVAVSFCPVVMRTFPRSRAVEKRSFAS